MSRMLRASLVFERRFIPLTVLFSSGADAKVVSFTYFTAGWLWQFVMLGMGLSLVLPQRFSAMQRRYPKAVAVVDFCQIRGVCRLLA